MSTLALLDRIRRDWAQRAPEVDPAPMLTFITFSRAHALLGDAVRSTAARADLTSGTRDLLFTLYRSAPPEGLPASEVAALLAVSPATVTGSADRLEARGLLTRTLDPQDRRSWRLALTDAGRALVQAHLPEHLAFEEQLLAALTPEERRSFEGLLRKLIAHAEAQGLA
ncbi:MarR family winged helix-turn-helix transcriptional regulator [Deinococcus multiflagellatus]|uniref:MarR family winged helix-turn-helix transcriptional regulator n=1 Tax=Deinococcus multiflagellatus TaxID=1656887 RepID=A0ABW1ZLQ8_9DEIO|nr:MarR family transcriptional regulator [Deinococcus multiflagellatus]MBZ9712636.1 MarR family transcriptional regulator [Deinococcus multiflagellatus]